MAHALEPGRVTFDDKMVVRKAIEEANIPHTYISANCFAGYFLGGLCQPGFILPSRDSVVLFGDGNTKGNSIRISEVCGFLNLSPWPMFSVFILLKVHIRISEVVDS